MVKTLTISVDVLPFIGYHGIILKPILAGEAYGLVCIIRADRKRKYGSKKTEFPFW